MLTKYRIQLIPEQPAPASRPEWAYHLYAELLSRCPPGFASAAHQDGFSPVSQYLSREDGKLFWNVSLLGEYCEKQAVPVLENFRDCRLENEKLRIRATDRSSETITGVEELLLQASLTDTNLHQLQFVTPAAFKSHGTYVYLPTVQLMLQSLVKKWNGCIPDCPIEDEDGEGVNALAAGLRIRDYQLHAQGYHLKGNRIPGFQGSMLLENRLEGFQHTLADMLLSFAAYSGIGIKTTLGMGGIRSTPVPSTERK